ncbi:MAG: hypothetical protein Kow0069_18220 [Promethearchaeota archaeon]
MVKLKSVTHDPIREVEDAVRVLGESRATMDALMDKLSALLADARGHMLKLAEDKAQLEGERDDLARQRDELARERDEFARERDLLARERAELEREKAQIKADRDKKAEELGELSQQQRKLLKEYEALKVDLERLSKIADEKQERQVSFERIRATLRIYVTLLDRIYGGRPHFRILYLLHGQTSEMTREQIKSATGIAGAVVMRALHELREAKLVHYDEDRGTAKLVQRFF